MNTILVNRINPQVGETNLLAFADVTIGSVNIYGIRFMKSNDTRGNWVSFPARKGKKGDKYFDIANVTDEATKAELVEKIQEAYDNKIAE